MTQQLSIVLSQMTQAVGDLAANADAMRAVRARHPQADLILFPELQLICYPPEDLVLKPALAARAATLLAELAAETADGGPAMLVGSVEREGDALYNIVALLDGGLGLKPRKAFGPLYVAISGRTSALPLFESMQILGRDRTLARLRAAQRP